MSHAKEALTAPACAKLPAKSQNIVDAARTAISEIERALAALAAYDLIEEEDDPDRLLNIAKASLVQAWEHARLIPDECLRVESEA